MNAPLFTPGEHTGSKQGGCEQGGLVGGWRSFLVLFTIDLGASVFAGYGAVCEIYRSAGHAAAGHSPQHVVPGGDALLEGENHGTVIRSRFGRSRWGSRFLC